MKKEILTYFLVFCLFGMLGVGVVNYFGHEEKTATAVGDSCTTEEKTEKHTDTSSGADSCEDEKQGNIID